MTAVAMDTFLHMGPLELEYWSSSSTHNTLRIVDTLGLILGMCFNTWTGITARRTGLPCSPSILGGTLQTAQFIWLHCYMRSYMHVRLSLTVLQRVRYMVAISILFSVSTPQLFTFPKYTRMEPSTDNEGSIRVFGTVLLVPPLSALLACVNHPLPFKHQVAMSVITLIFYTKHMHHHQVAAVDIFQLQGWVEPTCRQLQAALLAPLPGSSGIPEHICSQPGNAAFLMMYIFILLVAILPVHLAYWYEIASKAAWLKARGVLVPQASPLPAIMWVAYAWAQSITAWGLLAVYIAIHSHHALALCPPDHQQH